MENNQTNTAMLEDIAPGKPGKRVYHAPELTMHGELTVLTTGIGGSGADGGFYTSVLD